MLVLQNDEEGVKPPELTRRSMCASCVSPSMAVLKLSLDVPVLSVEVLFPGKDFRAVRNRRAEEG